jgi:RNA recognition motif-containing protein
MKLYVGNLVYNMTESELKDLFSPFGEVVSARIMTDQYTRNSLNFGYVKMSDPAEGLQAMAMLNGEPINNRQIVVKTVQSAKIN